MKCECPYVSDNHEKNDCRNISDYAVIRDSKIVFVCAECKMPEDNDSVRSIGRYYEDKEST